MAEVPYVGELEFLVRSLTQRLSDVMQECRPDEGGVALSSLKKQLDIARHQKIVLELELLNNAKKQVEASVQAIVESSDDKDRIATLQANNVVLQQKLDACHVQLELQPSLPQKEESSTLTKRLQKTKEPQQQQPFGPQVSPQISTALSEDMQALLNDFSASPLPQKEESSTLTKRLQKTKEPQQQQQLFVPSPQIQQVSPQASTSSTRELQARLQALKASSAIAPPPATPMVQSKPPPQASVAIMPLLQKSAQKPETETKTKSSQRRRGFPYPVCSKCRSRP